MKLLYCTECEDLVKFGLAGSWRSCGCGRSAGRYLEDGHHAEIRGECVPVGVNNTELAIALAARPNWKRDKGIKVHAFVIPEDCHTITRVDANPSPLHLGGGERA